jgi:hypothetical protein
MTDRRTGSVQRRAQGRTNEGTLVIRRLATTAAAALLAILGAALASGDASAASAAKKTEARPATGAAPSAPLISVVSIGEQRITVWAGDTQVARSGVSSGMAGHRTPTGIFSVIGKERYHESNLYSAAPMPYMQRITWSGVALHEGNLPGYPASHGCIRLSGDFAQRLYGMSRMGMRVIVADRDLSPAPFAHPGLPAPTFVRASLYAELGASADAPAGRMQLGAAPADAQRLLNPIERGRLEQGRAKALLLEAKADAAALLDIAAQRGHEARLAAQMVRAAEADHRVAKSNRDKFVDAAQSPALSDDDRTRAVAHRDALDGALVEASRRLTEAQTSADDADAAAFHTAAEAKAAVLERDLAEHAARVAERATEPLSVFVSRKERRVFVRQGFEPVFEADVEIADPQTPLGTHVLTAVAAPEEGGALRWVAMTIPGQARADTPVASRGRKSSDAQGTVLSESAAAALDRISFADEVLQKISEKLWVGASLIISDYGISSETGKGTDFVVLTR